MLELLKNSTVLYAEDEPITGEQTYLSLKLIFDQVYFAKDGADALDIYRLKRPDIVLLDINMPLMDGIEVAKKIRESDSNTPIIFITSYSSQEYLLEAANLLSDGYIIKPIDIELLMEKIAKSLLRNSHLEPCISIDSKYRFKARSKELYCDEEIIDLGIKERNLLQIFIKRGREYTTKKELVESLYPLEDITDSAIKNLIGRLRDKIGKEKIIYTKGLGWKLLLK